MSYYVLQISCCIVAKTQDLFLNVMCVCSTIPTLPSHVSTQLIYTAIIFEIKFMTQPYFFHQLCEKYKYHNMLYYFFEKLLCENMLARFCLRDIHRIPELTLIGYRHIVKQNNLISSLLISVLIFFILKLNFP